MCPIDQRKLAWERLSNDLASGALDTLTNIVPLDELPELADKILRGETVGRVVVDVNA